jgi:hypothetical protein
MEKGVPDGPAGDNRGQARGENAPPPMDSYLVF